MKLILLILISFSAGYFTCSYFYSKYTHPDSLSSFAAEAYRLGCLVKGKESKEKMSQVREFCNKKSIEHKKILDDLFDIVLQ